MDHSSPEEGAMLPGGDPEATRSSARRHKRCCATLAVVVAAVVVVIAVGAVLVCVIGGRGSGDPTTAQNAQHEGADKARRATAAGDSEEGGNSGTGVDNRPADVQRAQKQKEDDLRALNEANREWSEKQKKASQISSGIQPVPSSTAPNSQAKREIATIITSAAIYGVIGMTTEAMKNYVLPPMNHPHRGGCLWKGGFARICEGVCPNGYTTMRRWQKYPWWITWGDDKEKFGGDCTVGNRVYCCRSEQDDETWTGEWQSSRTGAIVSCEFLNVGVCGRVKCVTASSPSGRGMVGESDITGATCSLVRQMIPLTFPFTMSYGDVIKGKLTWFDIAGVEGDIWFKTKNDVSK